MCGAHLQAAVPVAKHQRVALGGTRAHHLHHHRGSDFRGLVRAATKLPHAHVSGQVLQHALLCPAHAYTRTGRGGWRGRERREGAWKCAHAQRSRHPQKAQAAQASVRAHNRSTKTTARTQACTHTDRRAYMDVRAHQQTCALTNGQVRRHTRRHHKGPDVRAGPHRTPAYLRLPAAAGGLGGRALPATPHHPTGAHHPRRRTRWQHGGGVAGQQGRLHTRVVRWHSHGAGRATWDARRVAAGCAHGTCMNDGARTARLRHSTVPYPR